MGLLRDNTFVSIFFVILSGEVFSNVAVSFSVTITFKIPFCGNLEELPVISQGVESVSVTDV